MSQKQAKISIVPQVLLLVSAILTGAVALWMTSVTIEAFRSSDHCIIPFLTISFIAVILTAILGIASFLSASERKKRQLMVNRRSIYPDQPWLWSNSMEWQTGRITALAGGMAVAVLTIFAIIWNGVVVGVAHHILSKQVIAQGDWVFLSIFAAAGLFLIGLAVYLAMGMRKYD